MKMGMNLLSVVYRPQVHKKNNVPNFQNQRCIGIFMSLCDQSPYLISHWTSEAKKYNVPSHHSCADPTSDINDIYVEKTPRIVPVWQKIRQSIPQLI